MHLNHVDLTPEIGVTDARFEKNPYIENFRINTRYKKQGMFVNMGLQMRTKKQQEEAHVIKRDEFDFNQPAKRHGVKCPSVYPSYFYDIDAFMPRTDQGNVSFSKQLSPRRLDPFNQPYFDSRLGRSSLNHNMINNRNNMYRSLDFQQTFHDPDKVAKGVDSLHKKSNLCLSNFAKQLPRELRSLTNQASAKHDADQFRPSFLDILPKNTKLSKVFETKTKKLADVDKYLLLKKKTTIEAL